MSMTRSCGCTTGALPLGRALSCKRAPRIVARAAAKSVEGASSSEATPAVQLDRRSILKAAASGAVLLAAPLTAYADDADDLTVTTSGLAWKDINEGTGSVPVAGVTIRCHYTGRLADNGKTFDSSYGRRPLTFEVGVGRVIKGWDLGILGDPAQDLPPMKEGGKRKLRIPAQLGYGARGAGGVIPPNADLDFEVELLKPRR